MKNNNELDIAKLQIQDKIKKQKLHEKGISEEFIVEYMPVVESVASSISSGTKIPPGIMYNDLKSWGVEGLIKAKASYDPGKGSQFKTYAYYRIRGEILDKLRVEWRYRNPADYKQQQEKIQRRIAEVTEDVLALDEKEDKINDLIANSAVVYLLSLEDMESAIQVPSPNGDPGVEIMEKEDQENSYSILWEEIDVLTLLEKKVIEYFYVKDLKQKEIAYKMNLSRSKVCRMHMKILEKLRRRLQRRFEVQ